MDIKAALLEDDIRNVGAVSHGPNVLLRVRGELRRMTMDDFIALVSELPQTFFRLDSREVSRL